MLLWEWNESSLGCILTRCPKHCFFFLVIINFMQKVVPIRFLMSPFLILLHVLPKTFLMFTFLIFSQCGAHNISVFIFNSPPCGSHISNVTIFNSSPCGAHNISVSIFNSSSCGGWDPNYGPGGKNHPIAAVSCPVRDN